MTGRTHDLAAFTALTLTMSIIPLEKMTLATGLVAFSANMIGGLAPDIDQPTGTLWNRTRGGSVISRMISPMLGGHRFISHSIIGVVLFGWVLKLALGLMSSVLLVDMNIVWWAFMIGFVSHLVMDMFSRDGVPLLFPIPIKFGIPPFRKLRMKTGGLFEKSVVFPGLIFLNVYIIYTNYDKFVKFITDFIVK
ncbi:MAG TPA: metal-dependent hydrolase [Candidatus Levybacteria bacterium]|nr:metal-dependent hydrolase [Candidatus Levybacteria bacterium]